MFTISNDELEKLPFATNTTIKCKVCGENHTIEYGDIVKEDGTKEKSKMIGFMFCPTNNECYMVTFNGKIVNNQLP